MKIPSYLHTNQLPVEVYRGQIAMQKFMTSVDVEEYAKNILIDDFGRNVAGAVRDSLKGEDRTPLCHIRHFEDTDTCGFAVTRHTFECALAFVAPHFVEHNSRPDFIEPARKREEAREVHRVIDAMLMERRISPDTHAAVLQAMHQHSR